MNKSLIGMVVVGAALGGLLGYLRGPKSDKILALFPAHSLEGYIEGTQVSIMANAKGHSITGGELLLAEAWAPNGIAPNLLLPTVYGAMKAVLLQNRQATVVRLYLAEDSLLARSYQWVAVAEYRSGRITVTGGFPTPSQLDSLKALSIPAHRPSAAESKALAQLFDQTGGLAKERLAVSQGLTIPAGGSSPQSHFNLSLETPVLGRVGKSFGLKPQELRDAALAINRYYWLRAGQVIATLD
jgi:hypothetical protein